MLNGVVKRELREIQAIYVYLKPEPKRFEWLDSLGDDLVQTDLPLPNDAAARLCLTQREAKSEGRPDARTGSGRSLLSA